MTTGIPLAKRLAVWAASSPRIQDSEPVSMAGNAFFDTFACMFGGLRNEAVQKLITAIAGWQGNGNASVFGSKSRFASPFAALVNGTAAHALDFDDNYIPAFTHCSAVMVPALMAIGEVNDVSGIDLIDAYTVGADLHTRIGLLVNPGHFNRGWHSTATVGTIGTAGACARLLGLNAEKTCAAMSIGFSLAAGSKVQFGSMMKPIHAGLAAQHAVMAAEMAAAGITAQPGFLTGPQSFQELYGENDPDREPLALQGLGEQLCLPQFGLLVKRFPCCGSAHKTLDGLLQLRQEHKLEPHAIQTVRSWLPETMSKNLKFSRPVNDMEARFSLHYNAARILQDGRLSLQHFSNEAVNDPGIRHLLEKIHQETIPDPPDMNLATPLLTSIEMEDGKIHEIEISHLKGSLQYPLSSEDFIEKLNDCRQFSGLEALPEPTLRLLESFDQVPGIRNLVQKLQETIDCD